MTTATLTLADIRIRDAVMRQLDWDPQVNASAIGVTAKGGVVTLTGYINSYPGKLGAERAAKRVRGVKAVANDIEVRLKLGRTDADLAQDAVHALGLRCSVPQTIQVAVHDGYVTLTGQVEWLFQKIDAEKAVKHIRGIKGVLNHIEVAPRATERDVRHRIIQALHRNADVNAHGITVTVSGTVATLTGTVGSWMQWEAAQRAATNAPGITGVENLIRVVPPEEEGFDEIC
jgi:osmotically-inducible protein OsmY